MLIPIHAFYAQYEVAALCYRLRCWTTFPVMSYSPPIIKRLGIAPYEATWQAMRAFTSGRTPDTPDEIWLLEHPPVYTLGMAGKPEHLLRVDTGIPLAKIDRGGQITYHGPGQLVAYVLLDMKRRNLGVRALVRKLECAVIDLLAEYGIAAANRADAPGVYVNEPGGAKIAALGLRVKGGCCYHGLALNIDMDLSPFNAINPCGYAGLAVTQLRALGVHDTLEAVQEKLLAHLTGALA